MFRSERMSLAEATADYCGWLKRMNAEIVCCDGRIVSLGEAPRP